MNRQYLSLAPGLVLALSTIVCYSNTFDVPFLFDDQIRIEENQAIRSLWPISATIENTSRPLGMYSLCNYALHRTEVWGYHAVNLAIHIAAGWTLFGIVRRTLSRGNLVEKFHDSAVPVAFTIALIWLVHPLNTQAVTYIVQRLESLMGLCYLAVVYSFIRAQQSTRPLMWYAASVFLCGLGMGTKEVMVTAPLMVVWYDRVFVARSWREIVSNRWGYYVGLISTWAVLAWSMLHGREDFTNGSIGVVKGLTPFSYLLSQAGVIAHYVRLAFWPYGQCLDYGWPLASSPAEVLPPLCLIVSLLFATVWAIFRRPSWGFLGGWFFVILAPTSSIVPIIDLAFEHRMYLPLAAIIAASVFAAIAGIDELVRHRKITDFQRRLVSGSFTAVVTIQMLVLTWARNEVYRSDLGLWEDTVARSPGNARAHNNLGVILQERGESDRAFIHCKRAVELAPEYADAHTHLGVKLMELGQLDAAVEHHKRSLALKPKNHKAHTNLALALWSQGLYDEGLAHFREAEALNPSIAETHNNLAKALSERGQPKEALGHYLQSLRIQPDSPTILNDAGVTLQDLGQTEEAIRRYRRAVALMPQHVPAQNNLGIALLARGDIDEAISHFRKAIEIDPESSIAYFGLGDAFATRGQTHEAIACYERSLAIQPDFPQATKRLNRLRRKAAL